MARAVSIDENGYNVEISSTKDSTNSVSSFSERLLETDLTEAMAINDLFGMLS